MELADAAETAARIARDELAHAEAEWLAGQARLRAELATATERIATTAVRRTARAAQIDANTQAIYDRLRLEKAGRAVAKLENASCMACGVILSSGEAQHARAQAMFGLAYCANCGRILFAGR
jgi:predicted  nucleic acid-binding Zn-ribbon protein